MIYNAWNSEIAYRVSKSPRAQRISAAKYICYSNSKANQRSQLMPLITCVECNKSLSTLAAACPHCGAPVSASVKSSEPVLSPPHPSPPLAAQSARDVNKKVGLKMAGIILILIGIALLVYQIVHPSAAQLAQVNRNITAGGSGSTATSPVIWWPSAILFVVGGALWKAGR